MGEESTTQIVHNGDSGGLSVHKPAGNYQHQGKRSEQQDSFGCSDFDNEALIKAGGYTGIVCDGMGGLVGGKEASTKAVDTFLEKQKECCLAGSSPSESLLEAVKCANNAVITLAEGMNQLGNCGSTLVAVTIHNGTLYWISVGDSHIYLLRNRQLKQLNKEHIYENKLKIAVERGIITEEDMQSDPQREALTSFIGIESLTEIDSGQTPLCEGDSVLLCSDGLYKTLADGEIAAQFDPDPQVWTKKLIDATLAKNTPHQDNVTALALTVSGTKIEKSESKGKTKTVENPRVCKKEDKKDKKPVVLVKPSRKKHKLIIGAVAIVLLCIAVGAAEFYLSRSTAKPNNAADTAQTEQPQQPVFPDKESKSGDKEAQPPSDDKKQEQKIVQDTDNKQVKPKSGDDNALPSTANKGNGASGDSKRDTPPSGDAQEKPKINGQAAPPRGSNSPDNAPGNEEEPDSHKESKLFIYGILGIIFIAVFGLFVLSVQSGLFSRFSKKR